MAIHTLQYSGNDLDNMIKQLDPTSENNVQTQIATAEQNMQIQIQQMITAALNNLKIGEDVKNFILTGDYYAKNINYIGTDEYIFEGHTTSINSLKSDVSSLKSRVTTLEGKVTA